MDGTFGGGDLISASLAIMLGGGTDAELHDKEVSLSTSQITGSQTAIFEYDPQNEPVSGDPAGPWDGYSLFTIDLSGVKDDIEDLQQQVSDLEDELEQCHDCWEEVVAKLQEYDPDYDPDEGECPTEEIGKVIDEKEQEIKALEEQVEECNQCKADVIAKLQEYDPDFDPQTCSDIPPEIDEVAGYEFPEGTEYTDIAELVKGDPLVDEDVNAYPMSKIGYDAHQGSWYMSSGYVSNGEFVSLIGWVFGIDASVEKPTVLYSKVLDPTTGYCEFKAQYLYGGSYRTETLHATTQALIGYGESGHTYKVKNS